VRGNRRLLLLRVPTGLRSIADRLPNERKLALSRSPYPSVGALLDDCEACAADEVITGAGGPAWDAAGFARLVTTARPALPLATARVLEAAGQVLQAAHEAESRLSTASPALAPAAADARAQFAGLRLVTAAQDPARDAERMAAVRRVTDAYQEVLAELPPARRQDPGVRSVHWMIEELRVSLFAQVLGTAGPVSEKRIRDALSRLAGKPGQDNAPVLKKM